MNEKQTGKRTQRQLFTYIHNSPAESLQRKKLQRTDKSETVICVLENQNNKNNVSLRH